MQNKIKPLTIGIIGGGQLGRMISHAAQTLGHKTIIFSDQENSPANFSTDTSIVANYKDFEALKKFASLIDVATFEFENIPVESVEFLNALKPVFPSADVLKITQNRILEKSFLNKINIATAEFAEVKTLEDLSKNLAKFGKAILKTATMGYDGKGQFVLENQNDAVQAWSKISTNQQFILEKFCPFLSEISVIVSRSVSGKTACYEALTNVHKNGILDKSFYPAKISDKTNKNAQEIAIEIATKLDLKGILAVEFFVMPNENLLVNELAPRPHNSGHFSMNGAITSQFEQLVRAITGLELGNTLFHSQGYMQNLIGQDVEKLEEFLANKNARIHLYAKSEIKSDRKMGHVNVIQQHSSEA